MATMARYTKAQIARRRRIAALVLGTVALLVIGGCTITLTKALVGDPQTPTSPNEVPTTVRAADPAAMTIAPSDVTARAHTQLIDGVPLETGEAIGIDVSTHQGTIDWSQVKADGYSFAYIKATEGSGYTDPSFATNWKGAQKEGITVGAYHYFTLCSPGADQALDFIKAAPVNDSHLPPAIDLEFDGACAKRPEAQRAQEEIDDFLRIVEAHWGRRAVVYSSAEWRAHYGLPQSGDRPDWLYSDASRPKDSQWAVWQLHFKGKVGGIKGPVDIDVLHEEKLRSQSQISDDARGEIEKALRREAEAE